MAEAGKLGTPPRVTLWSREGCQKTPKAQRLLESFGCAVALRDLEAAPPTEAELRAVVGWLGSSAADLVRWEGPGGRELALGGADDGSVIAAMARTPALVDGPVAIAEEHRAAVLARPPELVVSLLVPRRPEGTTEGDLLRRALQGKPVL